MTETKGAPSALAQSAAALKPQYYLIYYSNGSVNKPVPHEFLHIDLSGREPPDSILDAITSEQEAETYNFGIPKRNGLGLILYTAWWGRNKYGSMGHGFKGNAAYESRIEAKQVMLRLAMELKQEYESEDTPVEEVYPCWVNTDDGYELPKVGVRTERMGRPTYHWWVLTPVTLP